MSAGKVRQGGVFVEIGADAKKFFATLSQVNAQIGKAGKAMAMMGAKLTAVGTAITAPIAGAAAAFASVGDAAQKMAARTGMSVEAVTGLAFAAEQSGTDMATLEKGIRTMQRTLDDAATKGGAAADSLRRLGIDAGRLAGMSPEDQFTMMAQALSQIQDPGERAALAMKIFGRAGSALIPLLNGGAAGIAELRAEAERLGIVMDKDTADSAAALTDAMNAMSRAFRAIVVNVGGAVAPIFTKVAQVISMLAGDFSRFVKENGRFVQIALAVGGAVAALGVALTTAGFAVMGLSAAMGALGGVMAALASPIALVVGGLAAVVAFGPQIAQGLTAAFGNTGTLIGNAANTIAGPLRVAVQDAAIVLEDLGATAGKTFQGISDAITAGNLSGAMDMLWAGLVAGWLRGTQALMSYVDPWVTFLQNTFTYLSANVLNIWDSMSSGLLQGLVTMGAFIVGVADNIVNGVVATFDAMVAAVRKSWNWVQSFIVRGYNLAEENRKVDSEMAARAAQRSQDRPGVKGRLAEASEIRKGIRGRAQDSIDARNKAADATAAGRYDRNAQLAEERRAATLAAEARVDELAAKFAEEAAAVVEEREKRTASALDLGGLGDAAGAGQSRADVVGTFSAFAASGLGVGQNLQQKIADATKRTADAVEQMAAEGGLAAID
jgi:TP901 family phage tail tape measure protein